LLKEIANSLNLSDQQIKFVKRHLSSILGPVLLVALAAMMMPLAFYTSTLEDQVQITGLLSGMSLTRSPNPVDNYFIFRIKQKPNMAFKAAGLSNTDQLLFANEAAGAEFKFTVEKAKYNSDMAIIPVVTLSSSSNTYLRDSMSSLFKRSRIFADFIAIVSLLAAAWILLHLKKIYRKKDDDDAIEYDPIVVALARNPRGAAGFFTLGISVIMLLVLPGWLKIYGPVPFVLVYSYFLYWFHKHGASVAWIKEVLESDARAHSMERMETVAPKHVKAIEMLIKSGGDLNMRDKNGRSPLHICSEKNMIEAVDMLLRSGAKVDIQDNAGNTPLMIAAEKGYLGIVKKIIEKDANLLLKNQADESALNCAEKNKKNRATVDLIAKATVKAIELEKIRAEEESKAKAEAKARAEAQSQPKNEEEWKTISRAEAELGIPIGSSSKPAAGELKKEETPAVESAAVEPDKQKGGGGSDGPDFSGIPGL